MIGIEESIGRAGSPEQVHSLEAIDPSIRESEDSPIADTAVPERLKHLDAFIRENVNVHNLAAAEVGDGRMEPVDRQEAQASQDTSTELWLAAYLGAVLASPPELWKNRRWPSDGSSKRH